MANFKISNTSFNHLHSNVVRSSKNDVLQQSQQFFNGQNLIDLNKIFKNDTNEINRIQKEFEMNGWCFVHLPFELTQNATALNSLLTTFFNRDQTYKENYALINHYGYSRVDHKENIKLLTGDHLNEMSMPNDEVTQVLHKLSNFLDRLTKQLIYLLEKSVFKKSSIELRQQANLPESTGMLDVVYYLNKKNDLKETPFVGYSVEEVNCVPHFDPGLLSISFLSTCEGLQLKNLVENKWIDGPVNTLLSQQHIGVIWLGEAAVKATNNHLKAGIHRVIYPKQSQTRLTVWYEMCTNSQLENLMEDDDQMDYTLAGSITFSNLPDSLPLPVLEGDKKIDLLKRMERSFGLSMSKSAPSITNYQPNQLYNGTTEPTNSFHYWNQ